MRSHSKMADRRLAAKRRKKIAQKQAPPLGKGGVDATSRNIPVPLKGADGVVRSNSKTISLERTTPSAPDLVASQHLFDGAATPPLPRRGLGFNPHVRQQRKSSLFMGS